jgi:hypothetical protein
VNVQIPVLGLNHKRRVIYNALIETFPDMQKARHYFDVWQREYILDVNFVAIRFAATVAKEESFNSEEKSLFLKLLFSNLARPYESLPLVPKHWLKEPQKNISIPNSTPTPDEITPLRVVPKQEPGFVVFKEFALVLTEAIMIKSDQHKNLLKEVLNDLGANLKDHQLQLFVMLESWAAKRFNADALPNIRFSEDLRQIAHLLYLITADMLGPMMADRLLAQAIAKATQLPEALQFSPQELL